MDVAAPTGSVVHAPAAAVVTLAEPDLFYSGGTIVLDHGYLLSSSFLHLLKARGIGSDKLIDGIEVVGFDGFVNLAAENDKVQSWL